jgi:antitoxin component of RelBE/YafQ-DinJ toxin-antitoxin module
MSSFKVTFLSLDGKGWFVLPERLWQAVSADGIGARQGIPEIPPPSRPLNFRPLSRVAHHLANSSRTTPGEVVRLLFRQMVRRRAIPFPLQADSPESEVLGSPKRRSELWDAMNEAKPPAMLFNERLDSSIPAS